MRFLNTSLIVAALAATATAQVNYSENFDAGSGGWSSTTGAGVLAGTTACGGTGGVYRDNVFTSAGGDMTSPLLGTSLGGTITWSYDYKVADWASGAANNTVGTAAPWGDFTISWGPTATGPWTVIDTVLDTDDVQDGTTCFARSGSFSPGATDVYLRVDMTYTAGDYNVNFDNWSLQRADSAVRRCSGARCDDRPRLGLPGDALHARPDQRDDRHRRHVPVVRQHRRCWWPVHAVRRWFRHAGSFADRGLVVLLRGHLRDWPGHREQWCAGGDRRCFVLEPAGLRHQRAR